MIARPMRFLPYVLKHLRHNWVRTGSTVIAMSVCIFLFCTLQTVLEAVQWGLKSSNASRLITRNAISLVCNSGATFSELAFAFRITPPTLATGLIFAVVMGVVGGLLPALRAARLPIASALRSA